MIGRILVTAVILCGVIVSTTGCVQQGGPDDESVSQIRALLASERGPEDVLPSSSPEMEGLDPESSREVGVIGSRRYFVAVAGGTGVCLIIVDSVSNAATGGCGSDAAGMGTASPEVGAAKVVRTGANLPSGWTQLSDFLIVNPDTIDLDTN